MGSGMTILSDSLWAASGMRFLVRVAGLQLRRALPFLCVC